MAIPPQSAPLDQAIVERTVDLLGWSPSSWARVSGGYTPAARYVAKDGRRSAFVKFATTPLTCAQLRREIATYAALSGPFLPEVFGLQDHPQQPLLVIEDLSGADWPPPWSDERVAAALDAIGEVHEARASILSLAEAHGAPEAGWREVSSNPAPFLSLGLASQDWLAHALPLLIEAQTACPTDGGAVAHWDLRSDNLCFADGRAKIIDWAEAASLSNPKLDLGFWLPSLHFEGGPPPEAILPVEPEIAAWVSGFFAARAGLPDIPDAPFVRRVQREQLLTSLAWACRALRLPATP